MLNICWSLFLVEVESLRFVDTLFPESNPHSFVNAPTRPICFVNRRLSATKQLLEENGEKEKERERIVIAKYKEALKMSHGWPRVLQQNMQRISRCSNEADCEHLPCGAM